MYNIPSVFLLLRAALGPSCSLLFLLSFACAALGQANRPATDGGARATPVPVPVNRTIPPVTLPKTGLEFSASPTTGEIFRARIFEEPLVPIGTTYRLEYNADPSLTNWTGLPGDVTTLGNTASKLDALTPSNRFYRARVVP